MLSLDFCLDPFAFLANAFKEEHSNALRFICRTEIVSISKNDYTDIYLYIKTEMFCAAIFLSNCPPFEMLICTEGFIEQCYTLEK